MSALAALLLVPTVAVLPFRDLSGEKASIGEAIRETVTSDLRDVPGLRVIERATIDRIIAEQDLGARKSDLDPTSTARVGKLLGATLVVAGAYQRSAGTVRLTARFVKVETGEIVGTAKVDGPHAEFLVLQDRLTVALLKSAGVAAQHTQRFTRRPRPRLKSLKTIELYGDAAVERDDDKKRDLLKLALSEDVSFTYAAQDLDALEKRLADYDAVARRAADRKFRELVDGIHARLRGETDPQRLRELYKELFTELEQGRRWVTLLVEARALRDHLPPPAPVPPGKVSFDEGAHYEVVYAERALQLHDEVLRDGETFLRRFTASKVFPVVKGWVADEIERKRKIENGKLEVVGALAKLEPRERQDPCAIADVYREHEQNAEAQRHYRTCLTDARRTRTRKSVLLWLVKVDLELADWASTRADLKLLGAEKFEGFANHQQGIELMIPADG